MKRTYVLRAAHAAAVFFMIAALALPLQSAQADASDMWHKIFPPADTGPKPEDTLVAPFAESNQPPGKGVDGLYAQPDSVESDMSQPHRNQADIAQWLSRALPDVFAVEPAKYDEHVKFLASGMNDNAVAQYKSFMQTSNILQTLNDNHLALHAIVEDQPVLLNSMALDGRFRWLFEVPVTLTFLSDAAKSYEQTGVQAINQHVTVRLQVGRVPHGQGMDDLEIETFDVRQSTPQPPPPIPVNE